MNEVTHVHLDVIDGEGSYGHRDLPIPPPGWTDCIVDAAATGRIVIESRRIGHPNAVWAIWCWLRQHLAASHGDHGRDVADRVTFDMGRA